MRRFFYKEPSRTTRIIIWILIGIFALFVLVEKAAKYFDITIPAFE